MKQEKQVVFEHPVPVQIMAIDGTWRRSCILRQVAESGAVIDVEGEMRGLKLDEFFLLLSSTGLAYRRCALEGMKGEQMSIRFLRQRGDRAKAEGQGERVPGLRMLASNVVERDEWQQAVALPG